MSVHLLHLLHRAHQRAHAFQREIFALNRNQHAVRRAERVERNHAQRRRAVDKDIVKPIPHAFQHVGHDALAVFHIRQLNFRARQPDIRRKHHQALDGRLAQCLLDRRFPGHDLVHRGGLLLHAHAQAA